MSTKVEETVHICNKRASEPGNPGSDDVLKFKKRMLLWPNPVEYVNNMYGCHPADDQNDYFKEIFSK